MAGSKASSGGALNEVAARAKIQRIDAIMAEFHAEMDALRRRQRELLKRVLERIDGEQREKLKKELA